MDKKAQKADAWKKIQEEMKDRRTSKKNRMLLHFLLDFLLVGQWSLWS